MELSLRTEKRRSYLRIMLAIVLGFLYMLSSVNVGQVYGTSSNEIAKSDNRAKVVMSPELSDIRRDPTEIHNGVLDLNIKVTFPNGGANEVSHVLYRPRPSLHPLRGEHNIQPIEDYQKSFPDSKGEFDVDMKITHRGRYPTERYNAEFYVYYKNGTFERHNKNGYFVSSLDTVRIKDHPKGIEVPTDEHTDKHMENRISKEFEFVPTWKEETKIRVQAPDMSKIKTMKPPSATAESSSELIGYYNEEDLKAEEVFNTIYTYENLGTYKGKTVALEGRIVGYDKQSPTADTSNGFMMYGNKDYVSVEQRSFRNVEHNWRFLDQETGEPMKISGFFTFIDLDYSQGMFIKEDTYKNVENIYATENSAAKLTDRNGGVHIYSTTGGDLDPIDQEGWFSVTLKDADSFNFSWGAYHTQVGDGGYTGFLDELMVASELAVPRQYVLNERFNALRGKYTKYNPVIPSLKFVTTHKLGKTRFGSPKPTRYEMHANIPTDLEVKGVKVTSENRDVTQRFENYVRDESGKVTVIMKDSVLLSKNSHGKEYHLEIDTEVIDVEDKKDENGEAELEYKVNGGVLRDHVDLGLEEEFTGIATGIIVYDPSIEEDDAMGYTINHVDTEGERLVEETKGELDIGQSRTAKPTSIEGYTYTGKYTVQGKEELGSSYKIVFDGNVDKKEIVFEYKKKEDEEEDKDMDYKVRHVDIETGDVIQEGERVKILEGESVVVNSKTILDYTYTGEFRNDGDYGTGDSTRVYYEDGKGEKVVDFLYKANTTPYTERHVDVNTGELLMDSIKGVVSKNSPKIVSKKSFGLHDYTGRYDYNNRSWSGNSTMVYYDRNVDEIIVTFYYDTKIEEGYNTYIARHMSVPPNSRNVEDNERGYLWPGQGRTLYRKTNIYGYYYTGRYTHNGTTKYGNSQYVRKRSLTWQEIEDGVTDVYANHYITFFYDKREMPFEVEHRNIESNNLIAYGSSGTVNSGNSVTARPLDVDGYRYTGQYDWKGQRRNGNSVKIMYEEGGSIKVIFYYQWEKPDVTIKDFDKTDALEMYTNVGLVTERDDSEREIRGHNDEEFGQDVISTKVNANTSAVLDKYKSPLAIEPRVMKLRVEENGGSNTETSVSGGYAVLNTDYLDSLRVRRTIGGGSGGQTKVNLENRGDYADMEEGKMKSILGARNTALGSSGASLGSTEETSYAGRWLEIDRSVYDLDTWNDVNSLSLNNEHVKTENNELERVTTELDYKVHNVLEHKYVPRMGWNGLEYYEYVSSKLLVGTSIGSGSTENKTYKYKTNVDISDIKLDKTFNAEDLKNETNTKRNMVAREQFNTNGYKVTGHSTETERVEGSGKDPIIQNNDSRNKVVEDITEINYYEEFGYVPYADSSTNLMTQQAVPVGGKITYVNPYDYFGFPSSVVNTFTGRGSAVDSNFNRGSVNRDEVLAEVNNNVAEMKSRGLDTSVMPYNVTNSGFYVDEVDQFDKFKEDLIEDFEGDKNFMSSELGLSDSDIYKYKQPIRFDLGMSHLRLRDRVLVGRMTGYPVVIGAQTELDLVKNTLDKDVRLDDSIREYSYIYENNYEREFGYKPTKYDKALSGNGRVTYYYLPLEKENIGINDSYNSRLVMNGIGLSQFNMVEDHTYSFDKFLYGRGEDVIFSGERDEFTTFEEEAELGNESIYEQSEYVPQIIKQGKERKETEQINGTRTRNNSVINKELLED